MIRTEEKEMMEAGLDGMAEVTTADAWRPKASRSGPCCAAEIEFTKRRESSGSGEERWRQWGSGEAGLERVCGVKSAGLLRKTNDGHARARGRRMGPDKWRQRRRWLGFAAAAAAYALLLLRMRQGRAMCGLSGGYGSAAEQHVVGSHLMCA